MTAPNVFPPLIDKCWVITGATASGKSELAMLLAESLNGEILSLDSMAVYRGMDIGTAKPTAAQQAAVPHHLVDIVDPTEPFSVACYLRAAHKAVADILERGRTPIFVGGTPMYLKGILRGFDPGPPANWEFRQQIEADVKTYGLEALRNRLIQVDPLSAHRLHPNDVRRMTRALEVAFLTGEPLSHRQLQHEQRCLPTECRVFACQRQREQLHLRIDQRVVAMFEAGLVEETVRLLQSPKPLSHTATQAVGYAEVIDHLNDGVDLDETIERVQAHTRQLARRQETFLRSLGETTTVAIENQASVEAIRDEILSSLQRS
ncbi:IPP transferase [Roseimaritima multifibrata]|uniref:tRNA dimethylallyltransferase n=1 Tax=Roseimaritima multifibrata TaxID=1930274 RepID=A0A517MFW2_9BACT|nr:tRNA (adenosine(37)-N6)-dimethylallyltransferase MiaA [Roseimaritima multifibrata]QDS93771.1 IPP transferase [Roseimaritima multifibrata]